MQYVFFGIPRPSQGLLFKYRHDLFINSLIQFVCHPLPPLALRRRHFQTDREGASSHTKGYVAQVKGILNIKVYPNFIRQGLCLFLVQQACLISFSCQIVEFKSELNVYNLLFINSCCQTLPTCIFAFLPSFLPVSLPACPSQW